MCPICFASTALLIAGATSGGGDGVGSQKFFQPQKTTKITGTKIWTQQ